MFEVCLFEKGFHGVWRVVSYANVLQKAKLKKMEKGGESKSNLGTTCIIWSLLIWKQLAFNVKRSFQC